MTLLSMALHPNEETLSRLADQSELERMRSRAGRHLAHCDRCTGAVAALDGLGEAARGMAEPVLPPALLPRIVADRAQGTAVPPAAPHRSSLETIAVALGAATARPRHWVTRKRGAVIAAAAVIVLVALISPSWRAAPLAAASHGDATIFPRYPRPGATIGIGFVPKAGWVGGDTVWSDGIVDLSDSPATARGVNQVGVAAVLVRTGDGSYRGRLTLPANALAGYLRVKTEPAPVMGGRPLAEIVLLTSSTDPTRPSLDAMEAAAFNGRDFMSPGVLAAAFTRWAPNHPLRWIVTPAPRTKGMLDWVDFFNTTERHFARLATRLNARPDARPGELAGMASLAYRIEEPEAAAEWTERLVREHPEDPAALYMRVEQLHEMELRSAPRDSIARLIPSLDTLYAKNGHRLRRFYTLRSVVANNGDSASIRRWSLRQARGGSYYLNEFYGRRFMFRDQELRDSVEAAARDILATISPSESWYSLVERSRAYWSLGSVALARGDYRAAVLFTDSSRVDSCIWMGQDTRALALLAIGDTVAALPYLAVFGKNNSMLRPDSAQRMLGSHFNAARWHQAMDSVDGARQACRRRGM